MTAKKRKKGRKQVRKQVHTDERQVELLPEMGPPSGDGSTKDDESVVEPTLEAATGASTERRAPPESVRIEPAADQPAEELEERPSMAAREPTEGGPERLVRPAGNQLARARALVEEGRAQEAIDLYRDIVEENPASLKAHNNLGVLFDELGQHEGALEHFEVALRLEPDNVEVLTNLGSTLTALARFEAAEVLLRRALRVAPDGLDARLSMGILSFRRGLYSQAESELSWVCARDPTNGPAFYYRAESLNRDGQFEEAGTVMALAAELMPLDPRPVYTLGHLYDRRSLHEEAAEMYRKARELQVT